MTDRTRSYLFDEQRGEEDEVTGAVLQRLRALKARARLAPQEGSLRRRLEELQRRIAETAPDSSLFAEVLASLNTVQAKWLQVRTDLEKEEGVIQDTDWVLELLRG